MQEAPTPEVADEIHPDVARIGDPNLRKLAQNLPILRDGKPRRFSRFMECYEWTFTQVQREARRLNLHFVDREHLMEKVERTAAALWVYFGTKEKAA